MNDLLHIASHFLIKGTPVSVKPLGDGLINDTYKVTTAEADAPDYVLQRINHLSNEIGDTIYVQEIEKYGPEQLIAMVAHGDIDYTVCEENLARAVADSLPGIDISTAISFNQFYGWGVSKESQALRDTLNTWLKGFMKTKAFQRLVKRYVAD